MINLISEAFVYDNSVFPAQVYESNVVIVKECDNKTKIFKYDRHCKIVGEQHRCNFCNNLLVWFLFLM